MLATPVKPPTRSKKVFGGREKPLYTIHSTHADIFTIQKFEKTAVLAFSKQSDAKHFGIILEATYENTKKWPMFSLDEDTWCRDDQRDDLKRLTIVNWDPSILKSMCICNDFSMVEVTKLNEKPGGDYRLGGNHYSWEVNFDFYRTILEGKYDS